MLTDSYIVWCVRWRDGVFRETNCRSKEEAERLAKETLRLHPESQAVADWYFSGASGAGGD